MQLFSHFVGTDHILLFTVVVNAVIIWVIIIIVVHICTDLILFICMINTKMRMLIMTMIINCFIIIIQDHHHSYHLCHRNSFFSLHLKTGNSLTHNISTSTQSHNHISSPRMEPTKLTKEQIKLRFYIFWELLLLESLVLISHD